LYVVSYNNKLILIGTANGTANGTASGLTTRDNSAVKLVVDVDNSNLEASGVSDSPCDII